VLPETVPLGLLALLLVTFSLNRLPRLQLNPACISCPLRRLSKQFIMTTIEETLKHDLVARLTSPTPKPERANCMACGRAVNAERAKLGGRHHFCSGRCMDAYDAGWPMYGTTIADYVTRPIATRPRPNSATKRSRKRRSDAGKPRKRVLKAGPKALPSAA
jgi:hypothetical protein